MRSSRRSTLAIFAVLLAGVTIPSLARGALPPEYRPIDHKFGLRLEPGFILSGFAAGTASTTYGAGARLEGFFQPVEWLDTGPTIAVNAVGPGDGRGGWRPWFDIGAGVRGRLPLTGHDTEKWIPQPFVWLDADVSYVHTSGAGGAGFGAETGMTLLAFGTENQFPVGPFVRYQHMFGPDGIGDGSSPRRWLQFGVMFSAVHRVEPPLPDCPDYSGDRPVGPRHKCPEDE